jgi:hypothetical protein
MRRSIPGAALAVAVLLLAPAGLAAQQPASAAPTPAPKPCGAPENRQFDFWLGSWSVVNPQGKTAGSSEIQSILGGCVLLENWSGAGGLTGKSFNIYDAEAKKWHQTWVDSSGSMLLLDGAFRDGKMVLSGTHRDEGKGAAVERITWSKIGGDPNRVRQLWESSKDGGRTWTVAFDGTYIRKN